MVGKLFSAFNFALATVCVSDVRPCLNCEECRRALRGNHPDVFIFSQGRKISIEDVEWLNERLNAPPVAAERKVFIIDGAESMTDDAPHRLLKTLEELGGGRTVILVTAHPERLLPTIRSRCQGLNFSPVNPERVADFIEELTGGDGVSTTSLSAVSGGRPGYAVRMLLSGDWDEVIGIADDLAGEMLGMSSDEDRIRLQKSLENYLNSFEWSLEELNLAGVMPKEVACAAGDPVRRKNYLESRRSRTREDSPLKRQLQERALSLLLSAAKARLEAMLKDDNIADEDCRRALGLLDGLFKSKEQLRRNIHAGIVIDNLVFLN
jgi:hypothetical protein